MRAPLEKAAVALGLRATEAPTAAAIHPNLTSLALARGSSVVVLPLEETYEDTASPSTSGREQIRAQHHGSSYITCLAWFAVLKQQQQPAQQHRQQEWQSDDDDVQYMDNLLEEVCLLSGTEDGCLQVHSSSGQLQFRQRLHMTAVHSIVVCPCTTGLKLDEPIEDITVTYPDAVVRLSALDLRTLLKQLRLPSGTPPPLHHQRWELPGGVGERHCAVCLGFKPCDVYSILLSNSRVGQKQKLCIVTGGQRPPLAAYEAEEHPQRSTLQRITGVASSLTGVATGVASTVKSGMYSAATGGVTGFTGWATATVGAAIGAAINSRVPLYSPECSNPSVVCHDDLAGAPKAEGAATWRSLRDDARVVIALAPAPRGALLAAADSLGRVMLVDAANMRLVRMWKGYRDAQCGWAISQDGSLLLVLHAPKRQAVELWGPRTGQRLACIPMAAPCTLLPSPQICGSWHNSALRSWQDSRPVTTYVLDRETGELWDVLQSLAVERLVLA